MVVQRPSQTFRDAFSMGECPWTSWVMTSKAKGSHVPYNVADFSTQASQSGYAVDYATQGAQSGFSENFLNQNSQAGYSCFDAGNDIMTQDYMNHGSQGMFTQSGFNGPLQDDASHSHSLVCMANPNQLQSHVASCTIVNKI
ncbi:hypothetical protein PTKIN_Ptkin05aG0017900 [Pterospermum kingtungense]